MAKSSTFTKMTRIKLWLFRILDILILVAPAIIYVFIAFINGEVHSVQKIALTGLTAIAIILTIINFFAHKHIRSPIWLIIIGLYICIKEVLMPLIIMLAIGSILDDFFFTPLIQYYKTTLISSKTYDKRKKIEQIEEQKLNG